MDLDAKLWIATAAAVIFGVALEAAEDIQKVWEKYEWRERHPWQPLIPKLGLLILVLGLAFELRFQTKIGERDTAFRTEAATKIADAENQAANAEQDAEASDKRALYAETELTKVEKLIGGSLQLEDGPQLRALDKFAGTPLFVQTLDPRIVMLKLRSGGNSDEYFDAQRFAPTFRILEAFAGWKYSSAPPADIVDGISLLTWANGPSEANVARQRASAAAEALRCLLIEQLGIWPPHHEATILPEFPSLPDDGVLIEVGAIDPKDQLRIAAVEKQAGAGGCEDQSP